MRGAKFEGLGRRGAGRLAPLWPVLAFALLGGCVDAPSTTPREVAIEPAGLGLDSAATPAIADTWWTAYGDPQLDALIAKALAGSPTLAAAMARTRQAQSQLSVSRAATYPQVNGDGLLLRERLSEHFIAPPPIGGTTQWIGLTQASLSWSLDLFGKQAAQIERARATAEAAALDAEAARLMLSGLVTQAYIWLWRADLLIDVARDAVKQREGILGLTASRVRGGLDNPASERQAEALLAMARQDLVRAEADRDIAVHQIAALIGRGADAYDIKRPQLDAAALALPATLPADLLARRADIAAAQARIAAAFAGREVARKAFYPDINLLGMAGFAAIGLGPLFTGSSLQYGGGAAIHLPIFDAGTLRAEYAGATAGLDLAVADYNTAVITAVQQTADALSELRAAQDQASEQRRALDASAASLALATERYRSGLNPQSNVLDAESLVIDARRRDAALLAGTASARVGLLMAVGGGFSSSSNPARNPDHE
ncbi:MAG: efflux transporter outer membrane subunit [Rhizomicrobium sp.]